MTSPSSILDTSYCEWYLHLDFASTAQSCGTNTFNKETHLCCQLTVTAKPSPKRRCCERVSRANQKKYYIIKSDSYGIYCMKNVRTQDPALKSSTFTWIWLKYSISVLVFSICFCFFYSRVVFWWMIRRSWRGTPQIMCAVIIASS